MNRFSGDDQHQAMRSQQGIRIAVIPERYGEVMSPCASIRLHAFTEHFPADVRYLMVEEVPDFSPHVILWNRGAISDVAEIQKLADWAADSGARLVYDIDDNLLAMDEHPERESYAGLISAVRASIKHAHQVWCSTQELQVQIQAEGGRATLMPNSLAPQLWACTPAVNQTSDQLRLVYMGTRTHDADFAFLYRVLAQLHALRPGSFSLTLVGVNANAVTLPDWVDVLSPPAHVGASYPAFVRWFVQQGPFDLGLAPLMENRFNRSKSGIKVLDYAGLGVPTLASDVAAYREQASSDRLLVANDEALWLAALQQVQDDRGVLDSIRQAAIKAVAPEVFENAVRTRWVSLTR